MGWKPDRRPMTADRRKSIWQPNYGGLPSAVGGHLDDWEARWAPYDEPTYQTALSFVQPGDVVLDLGAGDLRLARRMANLARRVFALEMQPGLLANQDSLPNNLTVLCADARCIPWPTGITLGVLLMRHCTHVSLYVARLRAAGCQRLITNARWGMDVELMDLGPRLAWRSVDFGWYACTCGQTGFVPGLPEQLINPERVEYVAEVETCPACASVTSDIHARRKM
ncbi:MAG: rRNA adenine methyltransferase [Chloroflexi bacterium]|nr:rRNA adenine methyltransferase [Chloroflexota bacterium]